MPGEPGSYGAPGGRPQQNIFGILALVFGIVSIVLCCVYAGIWAGIPAAVLGYLGIQRAKRGEASNRPLALTGLILGAIGIAIALLQIILLATGVTGNLVSDLQNN